MNLTRTSINVDASVLERAKELNLNISHITREALCEAVKEAEKAIINKKLDEAYISDAKTHKELMHEFRHTDKAW
jgi:post-segregation antitoxin (ccd killing protein)